MTYKGFGDTLYDDLSGIFIIEMLLSIVSCHGYVQEDTPAAILMYSRKLVSYYSSKDFVILKKYSISMKKVPFRVNQCIHAVDAHDNYSVMTCNSSIPYFTNTLKKTNISTNILMDLPQQFMIIIIRF